MKTSPPPVDQKNLIIAILLSAVLVVMWQLLVENPKRKELSRWNVEAQQKHALELKKAREEINKPAEAEEKPLTHEERLSQSPRVRIASDKLEGSIALKGLRFDDLILARYRETQDSDRRVTLLFPAGDAAPYFAHPGWLAESTEVKVPDDGSVWKADRDTLTPDSPVTLTWNNGQGVTFKTTVRLDHDYMFSLTQEAENKSGRDIALTPYGLINRAYEDPKNHALYLHEGPLGVFDGKLTEVQYQELREKGPKTYEDSEAWLGFTDKYWLATLVPDSKDPFKAKFSYYQSKGKDRYQADFMAKPLSVPAGGSARYDLRFFAGAKELKALDRYTEGDSAHSVPPIPLFDRALDFGVLYFLTKPIFLCLTAFYALIGNFGLAILLLTIAIRLVLFPLANKSYKAMSQMRLLQPEMVKIKNRHGNDKLKQQQEIMALYKREKVNPAAGCLPMLIQIPVFFALYKVLFVTIEMRHAPFFGWLHDLSAADPSNIFTMFGLIPWHPPEMVHLGILPILMCASMVIQMRQQPTPPDPIQAKIIKMTPYLMLLLFAKMPAGLVLYWTWSNVLSIFQQWLITGKYKSKQQARVA